MSQSNEVKILSDREHVIKRPGMYIGSTDMESFERFLYGNYGPVSYVQGLVKIIDEIIDNSLDEAIRTEFKFANKISVEIKDNIVTIGDNGRGIPQTEIITPEGDKIPGPVAAWTRTKAGGNFGDDKERATVGMNGVGSSLTNFFSSWFTGVTCDGKNILTVSCQNGAETIGWASTKGSKNGTSVSFCPNFEHFGTMRIDETSVQVIQDRIMALAVVYPDIEFKFNGKKVQGKFKAYAQQFGDNLTVENDNVSLALTTSPDGFRQMSFVNGLYTKNGGSHIDWLTDELGTELMPMIKRKYQIEIPRARIKESLTLIIVVRNMKNMKFDSQTKERLTNTWGDCKTHLNLDVKKLAQQFMKSEALLMPIIEAALARKLAAEAAAATKAAKKASKAKVEKHIKANHCGKAETTLFLTEGDSAMGPMINVRDQNTQGGYPLRGKFVNTWGMSAADMLKNKEIFDICAITGLTIGEKAEDLQYTNIAIMTDADVDGTGSIYPSLIAFFTNWPEMFEQGRIRFVKTPLVIAAKAKGDPIWFYDSASYDKQAATLEQQGYKIRYIKGLGSLREPEYEKVIKEPNYDVVRLPENWKDLFEMLLGEDPKKRKEWMS
ncbi:DNA topoisomerase II large subunit [Serratia phage 92A1]|nr:DNA topoisomerase II large subunit [Serratia phage 92A1]